MTSKHLGSSKWKKQRLLVLQRDSYTCGYCGEPANEVDHIEPRVAGGSDDLDNLVACCRMCNLRKGKKSDAVFLSQASTPLAFSSNLSPSVVSHTPNNPFVTQTTPAIEG